MFYIFKNLLAQKPKPDSDVWIQLIIVAVIIGMGIIKAIIRGVKTMMEQKSDASEEDEQTPISDRPKKRYVDDSGGFKTLEQLREERIQQIRAAYGIPEPPIQKEPQTIAVEEPLRPAAPEPQYIPPPMPTERPVYRPQPTKPAAHTAATAAFSKIRIPDLLIFLSFSVSLRWVFMTRTNDSTI